MITTSAVSAKVCVLNDKSVGTEEKVENKEQQNNNTVSQENNKLLDSLFNGVASATLGPNAELASGAIDYLKDRFEYVTDEDNLPTILATGVFGSGFIIANKLGDFIKGLFSDTSSEQA